MSIKDQLLGLRRTPVPVAIEGVEGLHIRALSGAEFDRLRKALMKGGGIDQEGMMTRFVIACACDASGNRIFEPTDFAAVNEIDLPVLMSLFRRIQDLNNLDNSDTDELMGKSETIRN